MRRISFRALSVLVALASSSALPGLAEAQTSPPSSAPAPTADVVVRADALFREAIKLYKNKQYDEAEKGFLAAWALNPTYDVAANLGHTEFRLGKVRDAAEHLAFALRTFPLTGKPEGRKAAQDKLEEARKLVVSVTVHVSAARAEVFVDGRAAGVSPLSDELFLEPGTRTIEAKLEGYEIAKQTIQAEKGTATSVTLTLVASPAVLPRGGGPDGRIPDPGLGKGVPPPQNPPAVVPPTPRSLVPGFVLGAVGVAGMGTGIAFLAMYGGKKSNAETMGAAILSSGGYCSAPSASVATQCGDLHTTTKDAATFQHVGVAALVGGGVSLLAAGTYLLWPSSVAKPPSGMTAAPMVALGGGGLLVQGSF